MGRYIDEESAAPEGSGSIGMEGAADHEGERSVFGDAKEVQAWKERKA